MKIQYIILNSIRVNYLFVSIDSMLAGEQQQQQPQAPPPNYSKVFQLKQPLEAISHPKKLKIACITNDHDYSAFKLQSLTPQEEPQWVSFLGEVNKCHATIFEMVSTQVPAIITYLSVIEFTKLRDLSLCKQRLKVDGNKIQSLEMFYKMNLRELKTLRIDQNQISSLRSLRKCYLPLLQQIDMQNNEWSDPQCLAEMHAPKLVVVRLEDWTHSYPRNDDKKWFAKLQTPHLNYIRCPSSRRMRQSIVDQMLKKKYEKLNVMRNNSGN